MIQLLCANLNCICLEHHYFLSLYRIETILEVFRMMLFTKLSLENMEILPYPKSEMRYILNSWENFIILINRLLIIKGSNLMFVTKT